MIRSQQHPIPSRRPAPRSPTGPAAGMTVKGLSRLPGALRVIPVVGLLPLDAKQAELLGEIGIQVQTAAVEDTEERFGAGDGSQDDAEMDDDLAEDHGGHARPRPVGAEERDVVKV